MKNLFPQIRYMFFTFLLMVSAFLTGSYAQTPSHLPRHSPEPVGFFESVENLIFYVIIPLTIVVLYILWRMRLAKQKKEDENKNNEQVDKQ